MAAPIDSVPNAPRRQYLTPDARELLRLILLAGSGARIAKILGVSEQTLHRACAELPCRPATIMAIESRLELLNGVV